MPESSPIAVWDRIARFWDEQLGEGNDFQRRLVMPATRRLLGDVAGLRILDACCGNGNFARELAAGGASVVAFDGSQVFIDCARARTPAGLSVEYAVVDATDRRQMLSLAGPFDAAVCSMALMDLPEIEPLLGAAFDLVRPGGCFIFSVSHPCFNGTRSRMTAELHTDPGGTPRQVFGVSIDHYLTPITELSRGMLNQPEAHPIYHRPISQLLGACFAAGWGVDGIEEPAFPPGAGSGKNAFSWQRRPEIPPVLVVRLRKACA